MQREKLHCHIAERNVVSAYSRYKDSSARTSINRITKCTTLGVNSIKTLVVSLPDNHYHCYYYYYQRIPPNERISHTRLLTREYPKRAAPLIHSCSPRFLFSPLCDVREHIALKLKSRYFTQRYSARDSRE